MSKDKIHISKSGNPEKCSAKKKPCPLGGEHFDTIDEAYAAIEKEYETFKKIEKEPKLKDIVEEKIETKTFSNHTEAARFLKDFLGVHAKEYDIGKTLGDISQESKNGKLEISIDDAIIWNAAEKNKKSSEFLAKSFNNFNEVENHVKEIIGDDYDEFDIKGIAKEISFSNNNDGYKVLSNEDKVAVIIDSYYRGLDD